MTDEVGVYTVSFDRAGYGESDPNPKRSVRSEVKMLRISNTHTHTHTQKGLSPQLANHPETYNMGLFFKKEYVVPLILRLFFSLHSEPPKKKKNSIFSSC